MDTRPLINERVAADYLDISVSTIRWWRYAGGGPVYVKMGSKVRYRMEDIEAFISSSLRRRTRQGDDWPGDQRGSLD